MIRSSKNKYDLANHCQQTHYHHNHGKGFKHKYHSEEQKGQTRSLSFIQRHYESERPREVKTEPQLLYQQPVRDKYTIKQDNLYYRGWEIWVVICVLITSIYYPFIAVNELYELKFTSVKIIGTMELFLGFDIIIKFFLQELDEEGNSKK